MIGKSMNKNTLTALLMMALTGCMIDEPDLTSEYEATPYERCLVAYKGTQKVKECRELTRARISDADFKYDSINKGNK